MARKSLYTSTRLDVSDMPINALIAEIKNEIQQCAFKASQIGFNPTQLAYLRQEDLHRDIETATGCEVVETPMLAPNGYHLIGN